MCCGGGGRGWDRVLKLEGKVVMGAGRTENSLRVKRRVGWSGREKMKDEVIRTGLEGVAVNESE